MTIPELNQSGTLQFTPDGDLSWPDMLDTTRGKDSSRLHNSTTDASPLAADGSLDGM